MGVLIQNKSLGVAEGARKQFRGDINNRDNAIISHARWADHPQGTDDGAIDTVGCADDGQIFIGQLIAFTANKDLNAISMARYIEQLHQDRFLLEHIEHLAQFVQIRTEIAYIE